MRTVILQHPGNLHVADTPAPPEPGPGEALVRVNRVGICGTDWHAYHGRQPFFTYPRILGHELGVTVEHVNDPESTLQPGDRCAVEPYLTCGGTCIACRRGRTNCCATLRCLGVHTDGGMREWLVVPARKLHKSATLALDQLALVEMLGIGCHAVARAAPIEQGENALVIGAGPIGLSVVAFARSAGARVIVAEVAPARLQFCREHLQVEHALDARDDLLPRLCELTSGELPTLVFDATGSAVSMARTFDLVAPGGRVVFVGLVRGSVAFDDPNFHRREIALLASRNATAGDFRRIIGMLERGAIDARPWITHRATCETLIDQVPHWLAPDSGLVKAMLEI